MREEQAAEDRGSSLNKLSCKDLEQAVILLPGSTNFSSHQKEAGKQDTDSQRLAVTASTAGRARSTEKGESSSLLG